MLQGWWQAFGWYGYGFGCAFASATFAGGLAYSSIRVLSKTLGRNTGFLLFADVERATFVLQSFVARFRLQTQ